MSKLLFIAILAVAGIYAYEHYFGEKTPPPRLSPPDTVYCLERTSVTNETGLIGIPAGAELKVLSKDNETTVAEYRGQHVSLANTLLTRDLDLVDAIKREQAEAARKAAAAPPTPAPPPAPKPNPKLERLNADLVKVRDRIADIKYQLRRTDITLNEHRAAQSETAVTLDLQNRQNTLQSELDRLQADQSHMRELIRRQEREAEKNQ